MLQQSVPCQNCCWTVKAALIPAGLTKKVSGTISMPQMEEQKPDHLPLAVCGLHLAGQPLNHQLTDMGATLARSVKSSAEYKMYAISFPAGETVRLLAGCSSSGHHKKKGMSLLSLISSWRVQAVPRGLVW